MFLYTYFLCGLSKVSLSFTKKYSKVFLEDDYPQYTFKLNGIKDALNNLVHE